jgi:dienelactone hydrolase
VTIRNGSPLELQLYQQEHATNQPLVLFTSGDGGWSPFCADIAAHVAATGITVVGIDAKTYHVNLATPQKPLAIEDHTHDYDTIARQAIYKPGIDQKTSVVLAGWSLGAGYSVIAASQPEFRLPVSRVLAISLPEYGELAWRPADSIIYITHGTPHEKVFDIHPYLKSLKQTPIVFLNATSDKFAPFRDAQSLYDVIPGAKNFYAVKASCHHFEGGEKEFYEDLDLGISLQQIADKSDNKLKEPEVARD